jgi:hypothetical protein
MKTVPSNLPVAARAVRPLPVTWWSHLLWVAAAGLLGMAVAAVFAGVLQLPRNLYLIFYFAIIGAFLYAYVHWSGADLKQEFARFWVWGVIGGAIAAWVVVQATLWQPAPRSPMPQGVELLFDLVWLGLIYGIVDALLLSVLPVYATWQALTLLGWTARWPGRIAAGILTLLASMLVIGLYHLGYPEFRSAYVLMIVAGVGVQSLFYLLSRSALAPLISHVAMHIAAVLVGLQTFSQLPPHY